MTVYQVKYHMKFPLTLKEFDGTDLSFTINKIRSRHPSVLYFILHCFDVNEYEILDDGEYAYTSPRAIIGNPVDENGKALYDQYTHSFSLDKDLVEATAYTQIEVVTMGVDSENPLYFTEVMFQEGDFTYYHTPNEELNGEIIRFPSNKYVNLYNDEENYLQVIRPNAEPIHTNLLDKGQVTILAPHLDNECDEDDPVNLFLEAMNQTEQTISILR